MAIRDLKITPEQIARKGVIASPDTLTGTPDENKNVFDRLAREIIVPSVNGAIEMLGQVEEDTIHWETDEQARKQAEQGRVTAEQGRVAAEEARVKAEQDRAGADELRDSAESARSTAEQNRVQAESGRVAAEQERDAAEKARADETAGIVARATEQAEAAADSADRAEQAAENAEEIAGGNFIPMKQKGAADGVASLGADGKVPAEQLPEMDYAPASHATDKNNPHTVTAAQVGAIPANQKGKANGVASLDASGKVPTGQLPPMDYAPAYTYGTVDLTPGTSELEEGKLYFFYV